MYTAKVYVGFELRDDHRAHEVEVVKVVSEAPERVVEYFKKQAIETTQNSYFKADSYPCLARFKLSYKKKNG